MVKKDKAEPKVEKKAPEVVSAGVVRTSKETPMDLVNSAVHVRKEGDWVKVTHEEMCRLSKEGKLVGYDPEKGEALIKEK